MNTAVQTENENESLIRRAQSGDKAALSKLIEANTGLVRMIVRRYLNTGADQEELMQTGMMGLVKAAQRFDSKFGVRFSTYAVPMIAGEIKRYFRDSGGIKVSRTVKDLSFKLMRVRGELASSLGREPTISEIAERCGVSIFEAAEAVGASQGILSLDETLQEENDTTLSEIVGTDDSEGMLDKIAIKQALSTLSPKERQIVVLRYMQDKTQSEVASVIGISQVHVSRLEKKILQKLKTTLG